MARDTFENRFWAKVSPEPNSGCWIWTACISNAGYGFFSVDGKQMGAHRASYEFFVGPIPDGLQLDHKCRIRCCVNPDHLEPVTPKVNINRGIGPALLGDRRRTKECLNGHDLGVHSYIRKNGTRRCKICESNRMKNRSVEQRDKERLRQRLWLSARRSAA